MATVTLRPSGDGTTTGWTVTGGTGSHASAIVDDPDSNDADTSYVLSPNVTDGTMFVQLDDVPADFDPDAINSISIKVAHRRLNTPQMSVDAGTVNALLTRSDETTAISTTPTAVSSPIQAGYLTTTFTPSATGTHTVSDWNGARLALVFDHTSAQTTDTVNQIRITATEVTIDYNPATADPTRGRVSFAELETPFVVTRGRVSFAEVEVPFVATRGRVSFAEVEVPLAPTRGRVSFTEVEVPNAPADPTRGLVSFAEFEVPEAATPTRGRVSFAELETPFVATRGRVSFVEVEVPLVPTRGRISFAEFEVPLVPTRGRMSWAELEVPALATRGRISWAELEVPEFGVGPAIPYPPISRVYLKHHLLILGPSEPLP